MLVLTLILLIILVLIAGWLIKDIVSGVIEGLANHDDECVADAFLGLAPLTVTILFIGLLIIL